MATAISLSTDGICKDNSVPWKFRVTRAVAADPSVLPIVFAILGVVPNLGPCYGDTATIARDGNVYAHIRDVKGHWTKNPTRIGQLITVRDALRRVADHCKLSDADREAFFEEIRKWMSKDQRAQSGLDVKSHN